MSSDEYPNGYLPTDRGYVVIIDNSDGTQSVLITSDSKGGHPTTVYAQYYGAPGVDIHDDVELLGGGGRRWTKNLAQTYVDDNGLHVATPQGMEGMNY